MNKKYISILCLVFILIMPLTLAASNLKVTLLNQDPDPVDVNKNVDLRFRIENTGEDAAQSVEFEILPQYPFFLEVGSSLIDLGTISGFAQGLDSNTIKYTLRVDKNAADGANSIKTRYRINNGNWIVQEFDVSVNADSDDSFLVISKVSSEPEYVIPGKKSTVTLVFENKANKDVEDLKVKLNLDDSPFTTINSPKEKYVGDVPSKGSKEISFDLILSAKETSEPKSIKLSYTYSDSDTDYSLEDSFGLIVKDEPDYFLNLESSTNLNTPGSKGKAILSLSNIGSAEINYAVIEILDSEDYTVVGNSKYYLGNLESDDFETAEFEIKLENTDKTEIPIKAKVEFKDNYNERISSNEEVMLTLVNGNNEVESVSIFKNPVVIVILLVVVLFVVKKLFFKKKK